MGFFTHLFYPWGLIFQALALLHFIRRRPDTYWLYIILFLGPVGALVYLFVEALPDIGIVGQSFRAFPRRNRIRALQTAILDNPSAGNFEELGDLLLEDGNPRAARDAYDKAIGGRSATRDCFYRRGLCSMQMSDFAAALPDLERVVAEDPAHDFQRAAGLLAHACAQTGQNERAEALFRQATVTSTLSETYLNFADLLASEGSAAEARLWARKVLEKEPTMPGYLRRRERPAFRRARRILRRLPA